MSKHVRKKQKIDDAPSLEPLGVAGDADQAMKDEEEKRLESFLFGTSDGAAEDTAEDGVILWDDDGADDVDTGASEFRGFLDSELFTADGPSLHTPGAQPEAVTKKSRVPAWTDADDATLDVALDSHKRRRKLRNDVLEDSVNGREYESRLRKQHEKILPTPAWAVNARARLKGETAKRKLSDSSGSEAEDDSGGAADLLSGTGTGLLQRRPAIIPSGTLEIERLRDANLSAKAEGEIKVVEFHPSPRVPVLLSASSDRRLRLYTIDGHTNPHLQTLHIPSLPLTNATFHPDGTSVLLTGPRPFYFTYDLKTGTTQRSPRGLWGTSFTSANQAAQDASMEICAFDPSGSVLAVAGRRGHVHLVDWKAGGGQVVGSVKLNSGVKSIWWSGDELLTLGEDSEIYVWDVGQRMCTRRWKDDGGYGSQLLGGDHPGKYLAVGSRTGLVNVYGTASLGAAQAKPQKTFGNLTTSITTLKFNHDSQLLAIASDVKKDQLRMVHLPSMTAFSNWPTSSTPLGHVTSVDFSSSSEYVAVGNNRGRVLLYHMRHFAP